MMEKVKLTKLQVEAIEKALSKYSRDRILKDFATANKEKFYNTWQPLRVFNFDDMAKILYIGYEVEESFEVGDWVVYMKKGDYQEKVAKTTHVGLREYTVQEGPNNFYTGNIKGLLRPATPEEIKAEQERRVWAGIGREVNEWRKGDVYVHRRYAEAIAIDHKDALRLASERYEEGLAIGIYPYESFISFGGESHDN